MRRRARRVNVMRPPKMPNQIRPVFFSPLIALAGKVFLACAVKDFIHAP